MNTAMFLEGNGRNGKSTLIDLFTAFIGKDLCAEITPTQMRNEDRFAIMDLYGKLVNKIDDLGDVTLKDLGRFKSVVDSKSVRGEIKFKKSMSFKPHVLCIFACNDVPLSEDTSDGYYSRIRVISFLNRFVGTNENLNKIDELATQSELAGLFNASISAAKKAITNNAFSGGKTIADKQRDYVYASNSIARFVDEMCDISDLDSYIQKEELYNQYILWARDNKHRIKEKGRMTQYLDSLGIMVRQLTIDNERIRIYSGIDMDEHDR
jgi:putative DNA primase/helicase